ncbi:L-lactate dehydrogenase [Enterococcus faecalis]|nr:L-lactate dehydrogenase [Enterococcus faecalis]
MVSINAEIMKTIVNNIMKSGFDGILVIASNPVDVLTYVAWQASGLPVSRVIGTGTTLDTTRFRKELSQRLAIDPRNVHGYIIGEHGDSEVAVWSHTMIGTKPILEMVDTTERLTSDDLPIISDKVKNTAYEIIDRKQATYYGIGMSTARIVKAILNNEQAILPVSAYLDGQYGQQDVFTGIPAVVGNQGVTDIIELNLNAAEKELFQKSVTQLKQVMASLQPNA